MTCRAGIPLRRHGSTVTSPRPHRAASSLTGSGNRRHTLPPHLNEATRTAQFPAALGGGTLYGSDLTGFLRLRMRSEQRNEAWQLAFSSGPPERAPPQAPVPSSG
ncbi:hypothetical protein [Streptomyces sp. CC219B]|uniref:hypothetical protein n=1 Tax=Streptomyces sp. CC219B TaxID=3044574 RepID=UPI0024A9A5C6|nr:hypothetical protein [Streptomyces sp. CC219B]